MKLIALCRKHVYVKEYYTHGKLLVSFGKYYRKRKLFLLKLLYDRKLGMIPFLWVKLMDGYQKTHPCLCGYNSWNLALTKYYFNLTLITYKWMLTSSEGRSLLYCSIKTAIFFLSDASSRRRDRDPTTNTSHDRWRHYWPPIDATHDVTYLFSLSGIELCSHLPVIRTYNVIYVVYLRTVTWIDSQENRRI